MALSGAQWGVSFMYADPFTQAAWIGWQGHAALGVPASEAPSEELVSDLYRVAMFGDRGNHAKLAERIRETFRAHGVMASPSPDTRKPWERTDWNCALARVDHEGLHCPDTGRCADCPNGVPPCRGPLTKDEVDALVYQCRQAGDDSTYALVRAIEAALGVGGRDAT